MEQETDFGWALDKMRDGYAVRRAGWNGKGYSITLYSEGLGAVTQPFMVMTSPQLETVPWTPSMGDCLAYDWELAA